MKKVTEVMGAIVLIVGNIGTIIASLVAGMAGGVGAFIIALLGGGVGVAVSASVFFALNEILVNQENIKNMIQQFKFEKLYGNSKTDAIQTVKQYYVTQ